MPLPIECDLAQVPKFASVQLEIGTQAQRKPVAWQGDGSATARDRDTQCRACPMREANGRLVVAAIRAQTQKDEAEQASHAKDDFLATVSHEMRTPLSAVLGWARLLQSTPLDAEYAQRAVAAIGRNAATLAHMIDDLLDASRLLNDSVRLVLTPVDVVAVVRAALDTVRPSADAKGVRLVFHGIDGTGLVHGDAERLEQVIWNLLANAIKFTPAGGRVAACVESTGQHVAVTIVDTGQGISRELLPRVFDRFRQGDDATTRRHSGLGLGLGIARHLVELHGGTVLAASAGLGRGATFTVRLPAMPGRDAQGPAVLLA